MRALGWLMGLAVGLTGCVAPRDERVGDYTADGVHLYQQGAYGEARETFQVALALKPNDAGLLYNLGECYRSQGQLAQAEPQYRACLAQQPEHVACRYALAGLLLQMGRRADTEQIIQDWLTREPTRADPYALDGWYWHQNGDLPRAQIRLQQALEFDPHNRRALIELALLYEALARPDRALVLYERALTDDPSQLDVKQRIKDLRDRGVERPRPD